MKPKQMKEIVDEIREKRLEALRLESEADGAAEVLAILKHGKSAEESEDVDQKKAVAAESTDVEDDDLEDEDDLDDDDAEEDDEEADDE